MHTFEGLNYDCRIWYPIKLLENVLIKINVQILNEEKEYNEEDKHFYEKNIVHLTERKNQYNEVINILKKIR